MAEVPPFHEMLWPTLRAIKEIGGSGSIQEIDSKVVELARFTEEQQGVLHGEGPQTEISYRLAWCRTYLKQVGALENSARGVWAVTDEGRRLTEADMASIVTKVRSMQRQGGRRRPRRNGPGVAESAPGATTDRAWKDELLDVLVSMTPDAFERLSQRLLREAGFISVEVKGRSGDGGIDGMGVLRMSLLSFPVFFQCKRYRGSVGPSFVRDFRGAMAGRGDKGLLITTGTFSRDAELEARRDGAPPIDLIDGERLCDLLKEYGLGISTERVEQVTINREFYARK